MKNKWSYILLIVALLILPAKRSYSQAPDYLQMGVNVNERPHWLKLPMLKQTKTTWVRAFIEASHYIKGKRDLSDDFRIKALKNVATHGYKVLLSIKWNLKETKWHVPEPGSEREKQWFSFAGNLLDELDGDISILVLVNELTIDTPKQDMQPNDQGIIPFVRFQKRLLDYISALNPNAADGEALPIYAGGFTRMDQKSQQRRLIDQATLKWIRDNDRLAGADFHMHQSDYKTSIKSANFMRSQLPDKSLIVTEFSLVWHWQDHLGDEIGQAADGQAFAEKYEVDPRMTVAEYCTHVFSTPVPEAEWQDFLKSQPWFKPHYLDVMGRMMENYDIDIATYAFTLNPESGGHRKVRLHSAPWFMQQLLLPHFATVDNENRIAENYGLFDSFIRWQVVTKILKEDNIESNP